MQEHYIPSAQIISVEKLPDKKLRKYTFFNTQTGIKDSFYSDKKVNHIPEIAGELELSVNENQSEKFFQSYAQNIQKFEIPELIKFEEPLEKEVIETKPKKVITKLAPWQIRKLREKGFSWQEVREFCGGVSEWTIRRWKKEEENKEKKKVGRPSKIKGYDLSFLHPCRTVYKSRPHKWIAEVFSEKIGQPVSRSTVSRLYKKYGITKKRITYHYLEQQSRLEKIKPFVDKVKELPPAQLIAEDECAFYLNEAPRRAWGWKGERVISWRPGNIVERYTLMLCIRNIEKQGVISCKLVRHGTKEDTKDKKKDKKKIKKGTGAVEFHDFMLDVKSKLPINEDYQLLIDNAKIHKAIEVLKKANRLPIRELFSQININPLYLVAYCPQLNPVELVFNFLRKFVEDREPRTFERLKYVIEQGIKELQKEDMRKWFRHCLDYDFKNIKNEQ